MIASCPLCASTEWNLIHFVESGPILPYMRGDITPDALAFGPLDIVQCPACGHVYNRGFDSNRSGAMYGGDLLTNRPVDNSMLKNLQFISEWIGLPLFKGKRVLEIGGGSGHFARLLAQESASVTVYEPSSGLTKDALPEKNIELITAPFTRESTKERYDLIICRQVLEHVSEPSTLLSDIAGSLAPGGFAYLEVPRAEYIEDNLVVIDYHYAHVQYFHEMNFSTFACRVGLSTARSWTIKQKHDMGFLFQEGKKECALYPPARRIQNLSEQLRSKIESDQRFLNTLKGSIALYGANWQGASFFNLYKFGKNLKYMLDDTEHANGQKVWKRGASLDIIAPPLLDALSVDNIIICAHVHFNAISDKLTRLGYKGKILNAIDLPSVS